MFTALEVFLAITVGIFLGLLGGGGSVLTVPIFVYVLAMAPKTAIASSLAVVGFTSFVGSIRHWRVGNMNFKIVLAFAPSAMLGTFLGAKLSVFFTGTQQLLLFSIVMILAAGFMFKNSFRSEPLQAPEKPMGFRTFFFIVLEGLILGVLTGIVGVGGGFLIVPVLVLLGGLPMKTAVGTSLLVISLKSFAGLGGYIGLTDIAWSVVFSFSLFGALGIFLGTWLVQFVSQKKLKRGFAVFLVLMASFIFYKNLI